MEASLNCPRVHRICRDPKGGPWIELTIIEPGHKFDVGIPICTGTVRLDLDGPYELARFMTSLNKALEKFLLDEFGESEEQKKLLG